MKKGLLIFVTAFITAVMMTSCGSSIPKGMSEKTYDCGVRALEIMEKYNSEELTKDEADTQLNELQNELIEENKTIKTEYEDMNLTLSGYIVIFINGKTDEAEKFLQNELGK